MFGNPRRQQQQQRPQQQQQQPPNPLPPLPILLEGGEEQQQQQQQQQQWVEQERREAQDTIARAVQRYRAMQVPEEEFQVILMVPPLLTHNNNNIPNRLTFRRICFAVLAVVVAFVCVILQTLPMLQDAESLDPYFDHLLHDLLQVKFLDAHLQQGCPLGDHHHHGHSSIHHNNKQFPGYQYHHRYTTDTDDDNNNNNNKARSSFSIVQESLWPQHVSTLIQQWVGGAISWFFITFGGLSFIQNNSYTARNYIKDHNKNNNNNIDYYHCQDGVLHIPSKSVLLGHYLEAQTQEEITMFQPYATGVNLSWFIPCHVGDPPGKGHVTGHCYHPDSSTTTTTNTATSATTNSGEINTCSHSNNDNEKESNVGGHDQCADTRPQSPPQCQQQHQCFRGIHDGLITSKEIEDALDLGSRLILRGKDHFDIHHDTTELEQRLPGVIHKLQGLFHDTYGITAAAASKKRMIRPVAFRVHTVGPMDGHGVILNRPPASTLNTTNYLDWIDKCRRQNEMAQYSLPWPFHVAPVRDSCHVKADVEQDPNFAFYTSIFLSEGAGASYRGGVTLYLDDHPSNYVNAKHKIKRGVTVDGSLGRVIVSTGGIENRKCRLPTRAGLRSVLEIWWDCQV